MGDALAFSRASLGATQAVERHIGSLERLWQGQIGKAGVLSAHRFALTAAADWQPPVEGALITEAQLSALAAALNKDLLPIWTRVVLETANPPLATVDISWTVKHPAARRLIDQAAQRTGARLGEAVQFVLRDTIQTAYDQGLSVRETSALIQTAIAEAAPWQADMLARTDLNSLGNGASKAAASEVGIAYKTWLATMDDKTRPEHVDADGQTVPMDGTFLVGGEDADYPGDPNLSDAMACNCRCTLIYGDTLEESNALLSDAGGTIMHDMATKEQRRRKYQRRSAHGKVTAFTLAEAEAALDRKQALVAAPQALPFDGIAAIENKVSDDNSLAPRVILGNALSWPEMPVSFMAQTVTDEAHKGAEIAGRIDSFARKRGKGKMNDINFSGELTTPYGVNDVAPMIADQTMRYVSADLGASEWAIVDRKTLEEVPQEDLDINALQEGAYALGCTSAKIKAVTLVPAQAIEGAIVALTASADECGVGIEALLSEEIFSLAAFGALAIERDLQVVFPSGVALNGEALVASATDWAPPAEWFSMPELPGKMPLTITKEGRVYGHLATWDSCHASFLPSCVPPPHSPSNYGRFHTAYIDAEDGSEINVGKLMFSTDGGHADTRLNAVKAQRYYDKTGMFAAALRASDGQYGIWVCGALNPDMTSEQRVEMRRQLRLHPPSGDWRPYPDGYDLLCGLAVSVPGFGIPNEGAKVTIIASSSGVEFQDAIIASSGAFEADPQALYAAERMGLGDEDVLAERRMRVLAARAKGGIEALAALVGGKP